MAATKEGTKAQLLKSAGYKYNFEREIYINRNVKKVFSIDFLEDCSENDLRKRLEEEPQGDGWKFFFTTTPSPSVVQKLEKALG